MLTFVSNPANLMSLCVHAIPMPPNAPLSCPFTTPCPALAPCCACHAMPCRAMHFHGTVMPPSCHLHVTPCTLPPSCQSPRFHATRMPRHMLCDAVACHATWFHATPMSCHAAPFHAHAIHVWPCYHYALPCADMPSPGPHLHIRAPPMPRNHSPSLRLQVGPRPGGAVLLGPPGVPSNYPQVSFLLLVALRMD